MGDVKSGIFNEKSVQMRSTHTLCHVKILHEGHVMYDALTLQYIPQPLRFSEVCSIHGNFLGGGQGPVLG